MKRRFDTRLAEIKFKDPTIKWLSFKGMIFYLSLKNSTLA